MDNIMCLFVAEKKGQCAITALSLKQRGINH